MFEISVSYPLAFAAGVVSFLSPCVLPVVPGYLTFVSGMTIDELRGGDARAARRRAVLHALLFGLGFGLVFMTLGAAATAAGQALAQWLPTITRIGGLVVIAFGLYLLGALRLPWLMRERRVHLASRPSGLLGSVAVGVAFGAGWTPCIGPVLGALWTLASVRATMWGALLLLGGYSLGLAVPFILAALATDRFLAASKRLRRAIPVLEKVSGGVLLVVGILLVTGSFTLLSSYFVRFTPDFILRRI